LRALNVYLSNFKLVNTSPQLIARDAFQRALPPTGVPNHSKYVVRGLKMVPYTFSVAINQVSAIIFTL
jgi:hypothetical protein